MGCGLRIALAGGCGGGQGAGSSSGGAVWARWLSWSRCVARWRLWCGRCRWGRAWRRSIALGWALARRTQGTDEITGAGRRGRLDWWLRISFGGWRGGLRWALWLWKARSDNHWCLTIASHLGVAFVSSSLATSTLLQCKTE